MKELCDEALLLLSTAGCALFAAVPPERGRASTRSLKH